MVTVIMPVYNGMATIKKSIESILYGNYKDIELIVVDDGSTDKSLELLNEMAENNKQMRVFHKENNGVSSARNLALENAKGEYIWFFDCDDDAPEDALNNMVNCMKKADLVIGAYLQNEEKVVGRLTGKRDIKELIYDHIMGERSFYYGVLWNKLYKRDIIEKNKIRFDENISWCEDLFFNLDYYKCIKEAYFSENVVYKYLYRIPEKKNGTNIETEKEKKIFEIITMKYHKNKAIINDFDLANEVSEEEDKAYFTDCYNSLVSYKNNKEMFDMVWLSQSFIDCLESNAVNNYKKMWLTRILYKSLFGKKIFKIIMK